MQDELAKQAARANGNPSRVVFREQDHEVGEVRRRLARMLGCPEDEVALTPNATHGLHTVILGLDLAPGDELVATAHE